MLFARVHPSIGSRGRGRITVVHFRSSLEHHIVFAPIMHAFLVPKSSNFVFYLILKPISSQVTRATIFRSQGRPKEEQVQKRLPKGRVLGGSTKALFHPNFNFFNLAPDFADRSQGQVPFWEPFRYLFRIKLRSLFKVFFSFT